MRVSTIKVQVIVFAIAAITCGSCVGPQSSVVPEKKVNAEVQGLRSALERKTFDDLPRNVWGLAELEGQTDPDLFAYYIATDSAGRELMYATHRMKDGFLVYVGPLTEKYRRVVSGSSQIDRHEPIVLTDCGWPGDCSEVLPLDSRYFDSLRIGESLQFSIQFLDFEERFARVVPLEGIDEVIDKIDSH